MLEWVKLLYILYLNFKRVRSYHTGQTVMNSFVVHTKFLHLNETIQYAVQKAFFIRYEKLGSVENILKSILWLKISVAER